MRKSKRTTADLKIELDESLIYRHLLEEELRRNQLELYRQFPMLWLEERLGEDVRQFQWDKYRFYKNHVWDGTVNPLLTAWQAVVDGKWVGVESATSVGKTFWLARLVLWFLDTHRDALVVTTAPKEAQLKLHLWSEIGKIFHKFKKIRPSAELLDLKLRVIGLNRFADTGTEQNLSHSWQAVGFVAAADKEEESATAAQGFHRKDMLIIVEETPGVSDKILTAFKNTATATNNIIVAVGNPDNNNDTLRNFCELNRVTDVRISAYDFPNILAKKEIVAGAVTQGSIDMRKDEYGADSPMFKSRVRGISPKQSINSLIQVEWIDKCMLDRPEFVYDPSCAPAVGVDVARSLSGDKAAMAFGTGNILTWLDDFQCPNASHLAYNLFLTESELKKRGFEIYPNPRLQEFSISDEYIGVDVVGVGASTVETLENEGFKRVVALQGGQWKEAIPSDQQGKPLYNFVSLRAQMYWQAREDLRRGLVQITLMDKSVVRRLIKELATPKFKESDSKIIVESKNDIIKRLGHSPNLADAFVYWNWVRHGYKLAAEELYLPMSGG